MRTDLLRRIPILKSMFRARLRVRSAVWWMILVLPGLPSCGVSGSGTGKFPPPTLPPAKSSPRIFDRYRVDWDSDPADGWTRGMDMSGVSFNDVRTATLVTRRHVVMAKHFSRGVGSPVVFHDRTGKRVRREITALAMAQDDVMVGLLNEPVPANFTSYALPDPGSDPAALMGKPAVVSDQNRCLFIHLIAGIGGGRIAFRHDPGTRNGWGKNLVVGDSGNPAFLIAGKELVLLETHTTGGAGAGPYYGDPGIQASVRAAVAELDGSYQIRTVRVP